jgi:hypothetical protein
VRPSATKAREAKIDWRQLLADVLAGRDCDHCDYYIKHDLWAFAA